MTFDTFEDDELAGIKAPGTTPVQPKTAQPTKNTAPQRAPAPSEPASASEDINWGTDKADEIARLQRVSRA